MIHSLKLLVLISFAFVSSFYIAQTQQFTVHPQLTNINYPSGDDEHVMTINTTTNNTKLLLLFSGTGSSTSNYFGLRNFAANLGYDVTNLSYMNDSAAASLAGNIDSMAFNYYRQELCFGTPVS